MESKTPQTALADTLPPKHRSSHGQQDVRVDQPPIRLRFFCAGDPSRAFIAEAFARGPARGAAEAWADGDPEKVDPAARRVMDEVGVPLRQGATKAPPPGEALELAVSIRNRGVPAHSSDMSWSFDDPTDQADEGTRVKSFRRVRDEIKRRVDLLLLVKRLVR